MGKIQKFEDIQAWQKARQLNVLIYKHFKEINDFSFRDQILRSSTSIMNNIAEGFERQTNKEFKQFLYIAKGSAGETRSMLYLAEDNNYISKEKAEEYRNMCFEISKMLSGFIKTL